MSPRIHPKGETARQAGGRKDFAFGERAGWARLALRRADPGMPK